MFNAKRIVDANIDTIIPAIWDRDEEPTFHDCLIVAHDYVRAPENDAEMVWQSAKVRAVASAIADKFAINAD